MAEAITIPSPSVFLRASPPAPTAPKNGRRPNTAEARKKAPRKPGVAVVNGTDGLVVVVNPKQSKSRNGIYLPSEVLSRSPTSILMASANRLCDVQSEAIEVRRRETWLSAVRSQECGVWRV
jgi:hypothetical protein